MELSIHAEQEPAAFSLPPNQVHWHTPSENSVDGELFALEAHFVHQLDDSEWLGDKSLIGTFEHLAVSAIHQSQSES